MDYLFTHISILYSQPYKNRQKARFAHRGPGRARSRTTPQTTTTEQPPLTTTTSSRVIQGTPGESGFIPRTTPQPIFFFTSTLLPVTQSLPSRTTTKRSFEPSSFNRNEVRKDFNKLLLSF